jgi:hypothetical protein
MNPPGRDLNARPPEYEVGLLTTRPKLSASRDGNTR